jgi:phenylacetic acid degradation operon negative regulatory protein
MLFTLLGEFVLPGGGTAWTSAVLAAFARLGVAEKATRQALMRTSNAGWLSAQKIGRRTRWQLTPAANRLFTDGTKRIYELGHAVTWDGQWVLVQVRIPEADRRTRHVVRTRLSWAGFGSLGPGLWISPHASREAEAVKVLKDAGVASDAHVFLARRTGLSDTSDMLAAAWDLPAIEAEYEQFVADFRAPGLPADPLLRQLELVHAWRRFPALDPSLPRELLPPRWTGLQAAGLFADLHQRWAADAQREWKRLNTSDLSGKARPPTGTASVTRARRLRRQVEQAARDADRRSGDRREVERVAWPGVDDRAAAEHHLGVKDAFRPAGDPHRAHRRPCGLDEGRHELVCHRPRKLLPLQAESERDGLGVPDADQQPPGVTVHRRRQLDEEPLPSAGLVVLGPLDHAGNRHRHHFRHTGPPSRPFVPYRITPSPGK